MAVYRLGVATTIVASFEKDGAPFSPASVTLTITRPNMQQTVITQASPAMLSHAAGEFYYDITLDATGDWVCDWLGEDTYIDGNGDTRLFNQPSRQILRVRS